MTLIPGGFLRSQKECLSLYSTVQLGDIPGDFAVLFFQSEDRDPRLEETGFSAAEFEVS